MMSKLSLRLDRSLLCVIFLLTLPALIYVNSIERDLTTGDLLVEVAGIVILWLALAFAAGVVMRFAARRWFKELVPFSAEIEPPAPDRLTHYLAVKQRLHGHYEAEGWWDPERKVFSFDFRHVEIELPRQVHEDVMVWAQTRNIRFSQAVEALLVRGLTGDHLDQIAIDFGWAEWPKAEGGPPWM
jgi:hypothetical protein